MRPAGFVKQHGFGNRRGRGRVDRHTRPHLLQSFEDDRLTAFDTGLDDNIKILGRAEHYITHLNHVGIVDDIHTKLTL